jgi:RHS repeat-associated protein
VLSVSLMATGLVELVPSSPVAAPAVAASTTSPDVVSRPDSVSAALAARVTGHRVEDLSQRDEFTRVYANPDGTWSSETAAEPESVQDSEGQWHAIDTTLVPRDDGLAPAYAASDLVFSDGGDQTLVSMTVPTGPTDAGGSRKLDWRWPTTLPTPVVEGNTATYPDAISGGDLVVTATRTGFTHSVVLAAPPTAPLDLTLPVVTHGAALVEQPGGGLAVETGSGESLVAAPAPLMWDSSKDAGGQPEVELVDTTIGRTAGGTPTVTLSPDQAWLTDPATVYPVTIDPSLSPDLTADTWVQNADYTSSQNTSTELRAGTYDGGGHVARSFLKFNASGQWNGKHILSANLTLRNWYSGSCTAAAVRVQRLTESWSATGMTWANQPGAGTGFQADYTPAKGYNSSCAGGDATWNLAGMVQDWADGFTNNGIRIKAVDEASIYTWRKYRSGDYGGSVIPRLAVTYNSYPNKPGTPTVTSWPAANAGYSRSTTPSFRATVSDPDSGDQVRASFEVYQGATKVWPTSGTAYSNYVANGATAYRQIPDGYLHGGNTYTVKSKANDGTDDSASYSASTTFTVDTGSPATGVTATGFTTGQWTSTVPASNTFTFDGPTDTQSFSYALDGVTQPVKTASSSGDATVSWLPTSGSHTLTATATDKAGNTGATTTFTFGVGAASFTTPNPELRSTGVFPITVTGPPNATGATLTWRYAGKTTWNAATGITQTDSAWTGGVTQAGGGSQVATLLWNATTQDDPATSNPLKQIAAPAHLELRACFTYTGTPSQVCSDPRPVQLVPSAFGGNFPVTSVGPATVALYSGEATISAGDAVDTGAGLGRSFSSFDQATHASGPFGPGWSSLLLASGDTDASLEDNRSKDRTLVLVLPGGGSQTFTPVDPKVDPATVTSPVTFAPAGIDDGSRMILDPTATPATVALTRPGAVVTTWTNDATSGWMIDHTSDPTMATGQSSTGFDYTGGDLDWIAEVEPGTSPTCTAAVQETGCRGLKISYTGTGSSRRVSQVDRLAAGTSPVTVATYGYTGGLLSSVCGPDPDPGSSQIQPLCASYGYDTATVSGRTLLKTITPPGQTPWTFGYDATGRLTTVTRNLDGSDTTGTGPATWTIVYGLAPTTTGLPDLSAATAAAWGQDQTPTQAYAVFGPDHVPATTPTSTDLAYAHLWFTDDAGTTTNTAVHGNITPDGTGTGQWLVDTTWYDAHGNVIQSLDGAGYARVLAAAPADQAQVATAASTWTRYDADGTRVQDEWGPAHTASLRDGTTGQYRSHTSYTYDDQGTTLGGGSKPALPDGQTSFNRVVEARHSAASPDMATDYDTTIVRNDYDPVVTGDGNGWTLGTPTRVKVQLADGSWNTSISRYDSQGRQVETRQPGGAANPDGSGADAHAVVFSYYTAGNTDPDCDTTGHPNRQPWIGLACKTGPAGQPTGPTMPTSYNAAYNDDLQPTQVVETSSGTTRTTTISYDALGRALTRTVAVTGSGADNDTRASTTGYDPATGLPTTVGSTDGTITTTYDTWGRVKSYTDATGLTSAPTYTVDGLVSTFNDGAGTYAYTVDGPAGEHRRLPTSVDAGFGTGLPDVFTLGYDGRGATSRVVFPNGMVATYTRDNLGIPTGLDYTDPTTGTTLLGFSNTVDVDGRVLDAASTASAQDYGYDNLGRLTRTQDTRDGACTTRTYGFSAGSERTSYASYGPATDRTCQETTAAVSKTNKYDSANRIRNTGYTYDTLGRTLTTPAADTAPGGLSDLTSAYYANDMIKDLTQTVDDGTGGNLVKNTNYKLDPTGRISQIVNMSSGTETNRLRYRFSDGSDSPTSIQTSTDGGASWTGITRYLTLPGLGMVESVEGGAPTIQLANLHGDVVASQQETSGPLVIDSYGETDEYGNAATPVTGTARYGYLGSHQRSTDTVGSIALMGARAYDPATGLFLSSDPILNGGANRYSYPTDPVNNMDLTGAWWGCGQTCRGWIWDAAMSVLSTIVGGACAATTGLYLACDILGGALVGVIDYYGDHLFVQQNSVSGTDAFNAAVNGALSSIGGSVFGAAFSKRLKKWLWYDGRHVADSIRRRIESFHMDWLAGIFWTAWNVATNAFIRVLYLRS